MISLDPIHHRVTVDAVEVELQPLTFALFAKLLEHKNEVVPMTVLTNEVWANVTVAPDTLKQRIFLLRKALEQADVEGCHVQSVRGQGYRLVIPDTGAARRRWPLLMGVAAVLVMAAVTAWWPSSPPDLPANNRVVFWQATTGVAFDADTGIWEQMWINRLTSGEEIFLLESRRDPEQTLSGQARQARAALISQWTVFASADALQIRMQLIEPKTAATLRSDLVTVGDDEGMNVAMSAQALAIERIVSSGVLPLSSDALKDTDHSAWAQLRELATDAP